MSQLLSIRSLRESKGISRIEMASLLGVHPVYYREVEKGTKRLTVSLTVRIACILGTTYSELRASTNQ